MAYDVAKLMGMSRNELDELFSSLSPGDMPDGTAEGTAIIAPGTGLSPAIAKAVRSLVWQGKVFDSGKGVLRNRILPFGVNAVAAKVYRETSRLDGRECIVLDYSETSLVARRVRDEIRALAPGVYLGKAYWSDRRLFDFALDFNRKGRAGER
jgi:hypothetical protein